MTESAVEGAGHTMILAANGEEGLKAYRTDPAEVLVTDLVMPGKEGIEMILELKREFPAARVIAISAGGRGAAASYLELAGKLGASQILAKPFTGQEILAAITQVLGS